MDPKKKDSDKLTEINEIVYGSDGLAKKLNRIKEVLEG